MAVGEDGTRSGRRAVARATVPALADDPILERLDAPPVAAQKAESAHEKARRELIEYPGQWMILNARVKLSEASARRLVRSYQRAKPSRLVTSATGRFAARPFIRDGKWLVAAAYEATPHEGSTRPAEQAQGAPPPPTPDQAPG